MDVLIVHTFLTIGIVVLRDQMRFIEYPDRSVFLNDWDIAP